MSSFGEYVDGKTIAIVGPAPAPYDQSAEVDAHDLVYRTTYGRHIPTDPAVRMSSYAERGEDWFRSGSFPAGYGSRVDLAFYNHGTTAMALRGELDHVLADLDWAVFKTDSMPPSGVTNVRPANRAPMKSLGTESQVTGMLWDLTFYAPASVTVFGADFYTGDFENWYDPGWQLPETMSDPARWRDHVEATLWHNQDDNRRIVRAVRDLGWLVGDDRYLKALDMTFEEYNGILEAQLTRAHKGSLV